MFACFRVATQQTDMFILLRPNPDDSHQLYYHSKSRAAWPTRPPAHHTCNSIPDPLTNKRINQWVASRVAASGSLARVNWCHRRQEVTLALVWFSVCGLFSRERWQAVQARVAMTALEVKLILQIWRYTEWKSPELLELNRTHKKLVNFFWGEEDSSSMRVKGETEREMESLQTN